MSINKYQKLQALSKYSAETANESEIAVALAYRAEILAIINKIESRI